MTPRLLALVLALATMTALAACGSSVSTTSPAVPSASAPAGSTTRSLPATSPSGGAAAVGQTDTDWGRIWDTLPPAFPSYPGTTPADEAATGPATATLVVNGDAARAVTASMRTSLEAVGFRTIASSGPLEDGTYVLDVRGAAAGCKVNVTATPRGSLTTVTILYGAACPHP